MKLHKLHIRNEVKVFVLLLAMFITIAFVEKKQDETICQKLDIYVTTSGNNYFINKEDVYRLLTGDDTELIIGAPYHKIDLKTIERRVIANEFVHDAEAHLDLRGKMTIDVTLNKPIARFLIDGKPDFYLCESGQLIGTTDRYTARVMLVGGDYLRNLSRKNIKNDSTYANLYKLIQTISNDDFWKAQISQLNVDKKGYITIQPQVTKQAVEFGYATNIDEKLIKLKTFYKKILPYKGWNFYTKVNVEYDDQIICE